MGKFLLLVLIVALIPGSWFYLMNPGSRSVTKKIARRWVPLLFFAVIVVFAAMAFFTQVQAVRLL